MRLSAVFPGETFVPVHAIAHPNREPVSDGTGAQGSPRSRSFSILDRNGLVKLDCSPWLLLPL